MKGAVLIKTQRIKPLDKIRWPKQTIWYVLKQMKRHTPQEVVEHLLKFCQTTGLDHELVRSMDVFVYKDFK
jgi:hypothetical protein